MSGDASGDQPIEPAPAPPPAWDPYRSTLPSAGGAGGDAQAPVGQAVAPPLPYPPPPPSGYPPPGYGYPGPTEVKPSTDGFAIASLVFGIIGGVLFAVIFGFVALSRIKKSQGRKSGRGLAIAGLVLSGLWVVGLIAVGVAASMAAPSRDPVTGGVVDAGKVSVNDIQVGDCLAEVLGTGPVTSVEVVPCTEGHHGEAFATFTLPKTDYPGEAAVTSAAEDGCSDRVPGNLDETVAKDLDLYFLYPKKSNWALGDRDVLCIASATVVLTQPIAP